LDTEDCKHITIFTKEAGNSCSSVLDFVGVGEEVLSMQVNTQAPYSQAEYVV
jgi:hypothetical protein